MNEPSSPLGFVAPEPSDLAPLFPAYEIYDLIATGGMGAVYRAVQKSLDRTVAIKILPMEFSEDAEFCAGFEAEAKAMARLNHPNLISVYDFGSVNGMLFIVMEFVPGKSIYHSAYGKAIDPTEVIRLVTGVCSGLSHAHENGILHRDIKPSNILLTSQAEPKIGDFGLARPMERKTQADEEIFGTPGYTAPEVVNTPALVDHRADLFSVGVFLHELLTGKLPTDDARPASVIAGCDPRFDAIIRRATDPLPAHRYSSAAQIASELQQITAAPKAAAVAQLAGNPQAGAARPPLPRRTTPVSAKRQSMNFKWVGPLIAISIMAFCWYQFMNMKPKTVVVQAPTTDSAKSPSPKSAPETESESITPQAEISSTPPPTETNTQDIVKSEVDEKLISDDLKAAFQGKSTTNDVDSEPSENSETAALPPETSNAASEMNDRTAASAITSGQDPADLNTWKNKALEEFPAIKNPSSELARQIKTLKAQKETVSPSYFKNPQWPYLLAQEANLALEKETQAAKDRYNSRFPEGAESFKGKKYFVYDDSISWNRARVRCADASGQLAVIPDQATQTFITELANGRSLWIGASDQKKEGVWTWVDGTKMDFRAFASSQPNNAGENGQNFLACRSGGFWYDADDKDEVIRGYICEWPDSPTSGALPRTQSSNTPKATPMPKLMEDTLRGLDESSKARLGSSISKSVTIFDEIMVSAFQRGLIIVSEDGNSRVIHLKEPNQKQPTSGDIQRYYRQQNRVETLGAPIEGEFALFDERYQLHVFDKGIIVWRRSDRRLDSAVFN